MKASCQYFSFLLETLMTVHIYRETVKDKSQDYFSVIEIQNFADYKRNNDPCSLSCSTSYNCGGYDITDSDCILLRVDGQNIYLFKGSVARRTFWHNHQKISITYDYFPATVHTWELLPMNDASCLSSSNTNYVSCISRSNWQKLNHTFNVWLYVCMYVCRGATSMCSRGVTVNVLWRSEIHQL